MYFNYLSVFNEIYKSVLAALPVRDRTLLLASLSKKYADVTFQGKTTD